MLLVLMKLNPVRFTDGNKYSMTQAIQEESEYFNKQVYLRFDIHLSSTFFISV